MHVLDWSEADLGDPHADVATSLMLMRCCSAKEPNAWERLTLPLARWLAWVAACEARSVIALDDPMPSCASVCVSASSNAF